MDLLNRIKYLQKKKDNHFILDYKIFENYTNWSRYSPTNVLNIAQDSGVNKLHFKNNDTSACHIYKQNIWAKGQKLRITVEGANIVSGELKIYLCDINLSGTILTVNQSGTTVFDNVDTSSLSTQQYTYISTYNLLAGNEVYIRSIKFEVIFDNDHFLEIYSPAYMFNSLPYPNGARNAFSSFKFNYSGKFFKITVNPSIFTGTNYLDPQICVFINNILSTASYDEDSGYAIYAQNNNEYCIRITNSTNNIIELVEGLISKPATNIVGTFLRSVKVLSSQYTSTLTPGNVDYKIGFLGDSITVGGNSDFPAAHGYSRLFKTIDNKEVQVLGYGYGKLYDFASDSGKINDTVAKIQSMYVNITTTKKLVIALGTNDYGLSSTPAVTFSEWYTNLLDAIHSADPSISIYCISPLYRSGETSLLSDYRTSISNLCSSRSGWTTYIDGYPILAIGDLSADGLHPTTAGHLKYHDNIDSIIL